MSKTIIVTGGSGQDGSHMIDYLLENTDHKIYAAHRRLSVSNHKNLDHLQNNSRVEKIEFDLTDSENINQVIRKIQPEYFINFAANSFVGNSWKMPVNHFITNAMGVLYCLEAIRNFSPHTRFYNAGTSEQFGDVIYYPQDINHPFRPRSPYGAAKCAAHHLVKVYRESYGIFAVQGILFNHEGTRRGVDFVTRKITQNVVRIANSINSKNYEFAPLELGNIDALRDWSDAEDVVSGVWKMLNGESPKDYVLASGEMHSVREFVEKAFAAAGIKGIWYKLDSLDPKTEEYILADESGLATKRKIVLMKINPDFYRPAEVEQLLGDSTPARIELGWKPKTSFDGLVKKMVDWDMKNS